MFSVLSNGLSGMLANQRALDTAIGHIAGMGADNAQASRSTAQAAASPSTRVSLSPAARDYAQEAVKSLAAKDGFQISAQVVKVADQMLGTLINVKA